MDIQLDDQEVKSATPLPHHFKQHRKHGMKKMAWLMVLAVACLASACGGGDSDNTPTSGNSTTGVSANLLGKTVVKTVARNGVTKVNPVTGGAPVLRGPGETSTLTFVDTHTVLSEGFVAIQTTSFNYTVNGNVAKTEMVYGAAGWQNDTFTFTSANGGTFHTDTGLQSGAAGWTEGTFTTTPYTGTTAVTPPSGSTTTGQIAVWTSRSTTNSGSTKVTIDGSYAGALTQYYTNAPTCGANGTVTKTLSVGSHTVSAADGSTTWSPSNVTISAGGCLTFELK